MNLVIVESPTKARTLAKFLGSEYQIEASMGHIRDLPKSSLGVDIEHGFTPEYVVVAGREPKIRELKVAAKKAKQVYLATDPDREGEAIAYHVRESLRENGKLKIENGKFTRIVFHEITKSAIEEALKHPGKINMDLVNAQQGRRVLDRLVGYKLSPLLWKKIRRGLSAGRVQSVAVRLIVERERVIEAFKPDEYWIITVVFREGFVVTLVGKVTSKEQADGVLADLEKAKYVVAQVVKKSVHTSPHPPFMTSTLQRVAANFMGWSSKKTMQVAQRLYERGLITYHRTDSLNIANEASDAAAKYILATYGEQYGHRRAYKSKSKSAQEAHEAIRPTSLDGIENEELKIDKDQYRLYQLIWRRFVASQMAQAAFDRTTIYVDAGKHKLKATGRVMQFDGWLKAYEMENGKLKIENDQEQQLPEVIEKDVLTKKKVEGAQKFTEPPARYNEASLIKALEERGIGRPSTYAPIISTIQARQYVERQEKRFHPTAIGVAVVDFLATNFPEVMDYDFTAGMENNLDEIALGKKDWTKVIKVFYGPFAKDLARVEKTAQRVKVETEKTGEKCPVCKEGEVVIRLGRFGKFLSCARFPECKYTATYIESVAGVKCPLDGGEVLVRKTRKGKRFYGCANYPKCKWASWRKPK